MFLVPSQPASWLGSEETKSNTQKSKNSPVTQRYHNTT